jgi:hypothetical protein
MSLLLDAPSTKPPGLDAIRIRRGAAICPIYQAEEAAPPE